MRVDLPEPLGPISAWISPGATSRSTSSSAWVPPNLFDSPVTRRAGRMGAAAGPVPTADRPVSSAPREP